MENKEVTAELIEAANYGTMKDIHKISNLHQINMKSIASLVRNLKTKKLIKEDFYIELTDELLIEEWNAEILSAPQIAEKYGESKVKTRSRISKMQYQGLLGKKSKSGKKLKLVKPSKNKEGEKDLMELLKEVGSQPDEGISVAHKEMLIEVLHRILI